MKFVQFVLHCVGRSSRLKDGRVELRWEDGEFVGEVTFWLWAETKTANLGSGERALL